MSIFRSFNRATPRIHQQQALFKSITVVDIFHPPIPTTTKTHVRQNLRTRRELLFTVFGYLTNTWDQKLKTQVCEKQNKQTDGQNNQLTRNPSHCPIRLLSWERQEQKIKIFPSKYSYKSWNMQVFEQNPLNLTTILTHRYADVFNELKINGCLRTVTERCIEFLRLDFTYKSTEMKYIKQQHTKAPSIIIHNRQQHHIRRHNGKLHSQINVYKE